MQAGHPFARALTGSAVLWLLGPGFVTGQTPTDLAAASGEAIYQASCANCHGPLGTGLDRSLLGFEEELPDFTDCRFASREPDADWVAIAHEGGPVRGFSQMMPAFKGALDPEQLGRVVTYIRTLCGDDEWPRGELNLPRALVTEKAFPEDEWVIEADGALEGDGDISSAFVYEKRFGARSMVEVVIPYGWRQMPVEGSAELDWVGGLGDVVLGVKHAAYHSFEAGRIFSLGAEVALPTGEETKGLGADGAKGEAYASFGQAFGDAFLQAQVGAEVPFYDGGETEGFGRLALGRTWTSGPWGRAWTPMVEVAAVRELEGGVSTDLDVIPQIQASLNTRQHVLANVGLRVPATNTSGRSMQLLVYLLLDWFDGGFFEGW
ncbi:MAG: c-type cytochrome [Gemmatimonadota bacterium]